VGDPELGVHRVEGFVEAAVEEEVDGLLVEAGEVLEEEREAHVEAAAEVADEPGGADALALVVAHAAVEEEELEALEEPFGEIVLIRAAGGVDLFKERRAVFVAAGDETPVEDAMIDEDAVIRGEDGAVVADDAEEDAFDLAPPVGVELAGEGSELRAGGDAGFARPALGEEGLDGTVDFYGHRTA
jgi:hypothetical protein